MNVSWLWVQQLIFLGLLLNHLWISGLLDLSDREQQDRAGVDGPNVRPSSAQLDMCYLATKTWAPAWNRTVTERPAPPWSPITSVKMTTVYFFTVQKVQESDALLILLPMIHHHSHSFVFHLSPRLPLRVVFQLEQFCALLDPTNASSSFPPCHFLETRHDFVPGSIGELQAILDGLSFAASSPRPWDTFARLHPLSFPRVSPEKLDLLYARLLADPSTSTARLATDPGFSLTITPSHRPSLGEEAHKWAREFLSWPCPLQPMVRVSLSSPPRNARQAAVAKVRAEAGRSIPEILQMRPKWLRRLDTPLLPGAPSFQWFHAPPYFIADRPAVHRFLRSRSARPLWMHLVSSSRPAWFYFPTLDAVASTSTAGATHYFFQWEQEKVLGSDETQLGPLPDPFEMVGIRDIDKVFNHTSPFISQLEPLGQLSLEVLRVLESGQEGLQEHILDWVSSRNLSSQELLIPSRKRAKRPKKTGPRHL